MRISWRSRAALAVCGVLGGAVCAPAVAAAAAAPGSVSFAGAPRIGALFSGEPQPRHHFCTASVVDSPRRDLIVTAAHCLGGRAGSNPGAVFVPGYRDGRAPYGRWRIAQIFVDPHWSRSHDPDYDVAFATTAGSLPVEDAVGSEAIRFRPRAGGSAVAVGYPDRSERPVYCAARLSVFRAQRQLRFVCPGLPDGTSGGPLLARGAGGANGRETVLAVIGGYQQGGTTAGVSYASYLGSGIAALYRRAAAG
ncbi:trypsin-like serine peptidase [Phaeacidiphilus oryzae]|uniref:trypsin-like serine peptidase n=1 Tax=Phaeacidiphilus oryzae TaxID=348818 RepID=UPI0006903A52|nr:trypsin-like peptidase domain-containing protein [Phaeacidiphilus oryzae]